MGRIVTCSECSQPNMATARCCRVCGGGLRSDNYTADDMRAAVLAERKACMDAVAARGRVTYRREESDVIGTCWDAIARDSTLRDSLKSADLPAGESRDPQPALTLTRDPQPLTDEQIDAIFFKHHTVRENPWVNWRRFARAVLAAAGPVALPVNTSDASGSPSSYRARPSDPDLNPVSVKDLSASASPATKEQQ